MRGSLLHRGCPGGLRASPSSAADILIAPARAVIGGADGDASPELRQPSDEPSGTFMQKCTRAVSTNSSLSALPPKGIHVEVNARAAATPPQACPCGSGPTHITWTAAPGYTSSLFNACPSSAVSGVMRPLHTGPGGEPGSAAAGTALAAAGMTSSDPLKPGPLSHHQRAQPAAAAFAATPSSRAALASAAYSEPQRTQPEPPTQGYLFVANSHSDMRNVKGLGNSSGSGGGNASGGTSGRDAGPSHSGDGWYAAHLQRPHQPQAQRANMVAAEEADRLAAMFGDEPLPDPVPPAAWLPPSAAEATAAASEAPVAAAVIGRGGEVAVEDLVSSLESSSRGDLTAADSAPLPRLRSVHDTVADSIAVSGISADGGGVPLPELLGREELFASGDAGGSGGAGDAAARPPAQGPATVKLDSSRAHALSRVVHKSLAMHQAYRLRLQRTAAAAGAQSSDPEAAALLAATRQSAPGADGALAPPGSAPREPGAAAASAHRALVDRAAAQVEETVAAMTVTVPSRSHGAALLKPASRRGDLTALSGLALARLARPQQQSQTEGHPQQQERLQVEQQEEQLLVRPLSGPGLYSLLSRPELPPEGVGAPPERPPPEPVDLEAALWARLQQQQAWLKEQQQQQHEEAQRLQQQEQQQQPSRELLSEKSAAASAAAAAALRGAMPLREPLVPEATREAETARVVEAAPAVGTAVGAAGMSGGEHAAALGVEAAVAPPAAPSAQPHAAAEPVVPSVDAATRPAAPPATPPATACSARYCDEGLTHSPPDDEPYLGDRDEALQVATAAHARSWRSSLGAMRLALTELSWTDLQQRVLIPWRPQQPSSPGDAGATAVRPPAETPAAAAPAQVPDAPEPSTSAPSLEQMAGVQPVLPPLSPQRPTTMTPEATQPAVSAVGSHQRPDSSWWVSALLSLWRGSARKDVGGGPTATEAEAGSSGRTSEAEQRVAMQRVVEAEEGGGAVAELRARLPIEGMAMSAEAASAAAPARDVPGAVASEALTLSEAGLLSSQPRGHPALELASASEYASEYAVVTGAQAASSTGSTTRTGDSQQQLEDMVREAAQAQAQAQAAPAARVANTTTSSSTSSSLLDLIRSPIAAEAAAKFASARAALERRRREQEERVAAEAAAAAAAAAATEAAAAARQPTPFPAAVFEVEATQTAPANPEEAIRRLLSQIQVPGPSGAGLTGVWEAAPLEASPWSGSAAQQQQPPSAAGGAAGTGGMGVRARRLQALEPTAGEEDWVRSMAAMYAGSSRTTSSSSSSTNTTSSGSGRQPASTATESYTDETSAALELDSAGADSAPPAASSSGRRTLFGEPLQVLIPEGVTVRGLAALLGAPPARLEAFLREQLGEEVRSDREEVTPESAELAALEFGRIGIVRRDGASSGFPLEPRQPVVTILGHVDHGKTSLLDALRSTAVAAGEAGGITQHIGAFEVRLGAAAAESSLPSAITFVDTPGHEAFSAMRARGAAVTDIAVLVVAADEGVKPQTQEALAHARSAGCPVVVAITKCDKPTARPDYVKAQLAAEGLDLEDFGGTVQVVHTSATTGEGLRELEEALLLQAELMDLQAPRDGPASGSVIEARLERGLGPVATVIVKRGTLRVGDPVVVGTEFGRIRALRTEAAASGAGTGVGEGPSPSVAQQGVRPGQYALVSGLEGLPHAGDQLTAVPNAARARLLADARRLRAEEFRRLQLAAALHAQRQRETQQLAEEYQRRRAQKAERMRLLSERKRLSAQRLRERAEQLRAAEAAAGGAGQPPEAAPLDDGAASGPAGVQPADSVPGAGAVGMDADVGLAPIAHLNLVVKADVQGSVEAVLALVDSLAAEQRAAAAAGAGAGAGTPGGAGGSAGGYVAVKVVHAGVGALSPSDVNLAVAAGAHLLLFNTPLGPEVEGPLRSAQSGGVRLMSHSVVYHLMDALREEVRRAAEEGAAAGAAAGEGGPEAALAVVGEAEVLATFPLTSAKKVKDGRIAGVKVLTGEVSQAGTEVWRVVRGDQVVWEGPCTSLRQHRAVVEAVAAGLECGVVLGGGQFSAFEVGDRLLCLRRGR